MGYSEHHCTQGCSSRRGFAILASSGTLGTISPPGLRAEAPLGPQGASPPGLQDFGVAEQFPDGGKGLGAEPGQRSLGMGRSAQASESRLDGRADGPGSRAVARGRGEGAAEETGRDGPAGSRCCPGKRRPDPVPRPPRRVAAGRAGAARGCGALPAAGAAIVCLQSRCFRQNQKHQLGKSSSQKILRLQNRSSKTPKRESV